MKFYRRAYGCDPIERRHLLIILRPWGALAVFAGVAGFAIIGVPASRSWIEAGLFLLLVMRIGYPFRLRRELLEISRIPSRNNLINIALLVGGSVILATDFVQQLSASPVLASTPAP